MLLNIYTIRIVKSIKLFRLSLCGNNLQNLISARIILAYFLNDKVTKIIKSVRHVHFDCSIDIKHFYSYYLERYRLLATADIAFLKVQDLREDS